MNPDEYEVYVKNPDQLIDLVREVIASLMSRDSKMDTIAMEAQLREIARAVENLEKVNIPVPETLRAEKTRLAAAVEVSAGAAQALTQLLEGLEGVLNEYKPIKYRVAEAKAPRRICKRRSTSPKTSRKILREMIIEALRYFGGSAQKREVHKYLDEKLKGTFLPGDMEWRKSSRDYAWQNNTDWERYRMTQDGILKQGSPIGIWELSEEYR